MQFLAPRRRAGRPARRRAAGAALLALCAALTLPAPSASASPLPVPARASADATGIAAATASPASADPMRFARDAAQFRAASGAALGGATVIPLSQEFLAGAGGGSSIDRQYLTFGVQPSGAKKPDARPNLSYTNLKPGDRLFDRVAILNLGLKPISLSFYAADAFNTVDGAYDVLGKGERSKDLGSWVRLRRNRASVPARSALITPIELRIPRGVEPGDHAAAIVAELVVTGRDSKGNIVRRVNRTGTRLYARIDGKLHPKVGLDCRTARYHGNPLRGDADVTYTIRNTGNVRLVGLQTLRVTNLLGMSARAVKVPPVPELLPGNEFRFTQRVKGVVPTFLNTAHVVMDPKSVTGNIDPAMAQASAATRFFAMSWPGLVLLALLLGVGGRFWWRRRRARPAAGPNQWGGGDGPDGPSGGPGGGGLERPEPSDPEPPQAPASSPKGLGVNARLRWVAAGLLGAVALLAPASTLPAHAAGGGTLSFLPGSGVAATPMWAITSGPCPKQATNVAGLAFGNGFKPEGKIIVPSQDAPVRHDGAFGVPFQDSMVNFAREEGAKLRGPYKIVINCVDQFNLKTYASFTGTVTYSGDHFSAAVPKKPPVAGVPMEILALVFGEYKKILLAQGKQRQQELAQDAGATPTASSAPRPTASTVALSVRPASSRHDGSIGGAVVLAVLIILGLAGAGFWWTRRPAAAGPGAASLEWPDDKPGRAAQESAVRR